MRKIKQEINDILDEICPESCNIEFCIKKNCTEEQLREDIRLKAVEKGLDPEYVDIYVFTSKVDEDSVLIRRF
jgi:hypothetical protein